MCNRNLFYRSGSKGCNFLPGSGETSYEGTWPGFYTGNSTWIKPDVFLKWEGEQKWDNSDYIIELLEKNGFHIYDEIQYTE